MHAKASTDDPSPGRDCAEQQDPAPVAGSIDEALIFLVDGDAAVRDAIATALRAAGFGVATFSSARRFLDEYRSAQGCCLVVDGDLPGVDPEILRMLATPALTVPAIITTRRLRRRTLGPALSAPRVVLLEKPFGIDDLLPLIRAAIAADRSGDSGILPT